VITRVSDLQTSYMVQDTLTRLRQRIDDLSVQAATGSRVNKPSDDPPGAGELVRATSTLETLKQDERAGTFARGFLSAQDGVLDDARHIVDRAREIAVQQANGTLTAANRAAAAEEVHALLEAITALGNTTLGGRRLFSGGEDASGTAPFVDPNDPGFDPADPYVGSARGLEVEVGSGELLRVTTPGDQIFGNAIEALADLEAELAANADPTSVLPQLDLAAADLSAERASVGTRLQRVDQRAAEITRADLITTEHVSSIQSADIAEVAIQLAQLQGQLQVAAATAQRILDTNLVNLLRI
jgi:flagellar hook-associated protein 3 FlgL